jgi:ABC-type branched-subunit amino acid transport system substrate-binding protein
MRKVLVLLSIFIFCAVFGYAPAQAANPSEIKVGILLPLTGTFAAVAETQKEGALLAVDVVNKRGGLNMPWGKVKVEAVVADDEAKQDVGVRRYRYMVSEGVKGVGGQTWAPLAFAINAIVSKEPMPYFPISVIPKEGFMKGKLAPSTFAVLNTPWSIGYMDGAAAIKTLGKKKIFFLARADSWGWDIRDGLYAAAKEYGGEIIGYEEVSMGTNDFTTILQKVKAAKPDIFISAQFGGDAIALLKQTHQMGLNKEMTIFNAFITNVVAKGLTPEALENVYSLSYFYYDLSELGDAEVAKSAKAFTDLYQAKYNKPPDAYTAIGYVAYTEMFRAFEAAKTFDPMQIASALLGDKREFNTMKGPAKWREDHQAVYKYATFLVKGKGPLEQKHAWDLFKVVGYQGGDAVMPTLQSLGY